MIKISVTIYNIRLKNYLNLSYDKINSPTQSRGDLTTLAIAINDLKQNLIKKENQSTTFDNLIVNSSLMLSTVHSTLSPTFTSIIRAIVAGRVVLIESFLDEPLPNFVFCLNNNTITSTLFLFIIIYIVSTIYNLLRKTTLKTVSFIYYEILSIIIELFLR